MSEELKGAIIMWLITLAIGGIGSGLEKLGNVKRWPLLVSIGKKLEALGQDGPKLAGKPAPDERILKAEVRAEKQSKQAAEVWPTDPPLP